MQDKLSKKQILLYKIKLHIVQILLAATVCLTLLFLFIDFTKSPTPKDMPEESASNKIEDEAGSFDGNYNATGKIAAIVSSIEEEIHGDKDDFDNVIVKEESYNPVKEDQFLIAVVIDDMGINEENSKKIIGLKAKLTTSFLTYGENLKKFLASAKAANKEIIAHIPMEPYAASNTAPDQLTVDMENGEIEEKLKMVLDHFDKGLIGGNNHMGSKFTENREKMAVVMNVLAKRKMFFLDSKTSTNAVGCDIAKEFKVKCVNRDVFLDNEDDYDSILNQLKQTEKVASKKGYAVAIGHPKTQTVRALHDWAEKLDKKRFKLVHLSEILKKIKNKQKNS